MGKRICREYSAEFKAESLRLVDEKGTSCAQVARDLGIPSEEPEQARK